MREYKLKNGIELKEFINELIEKSQSNKVRVDKIKKLLLTGNF